MSLVPTVVLILSRQTTDERKLFQKSAGHIYVFTNRLVCDGVFDFLMPNVGEAYIWHISCTITDYKSSIVVY